MFSTVFWTVAETVRWSQWNRQLVPKLRSGDIKLPVAQTSSGPQYDACDGARRSETATGLRRRLAFVWDIRQLAAVSHRLIYNSRLGYLLFWGRISTCCHSVATLKSTRRQTGSQCNSSRTDEMCSRRPVRVINLLVAFWVKKEQLWFICCVVIQPVFKSKQRYLAKADATVLQCCP